MPLPLGSFTTDAVGALDVVSPTNVGDLVGIPVSKCVGCVVGTADVGGSVRRVGGKEGERVDGTSDGDAEVGDSVSSPLPLLLPVLLLLLPLLLLLQF